MPFCPYCGKNFKNVGGMLRHIKYHCRENKLGNYSNGT